MGVMQRIREVVTPPDDQAVAGVTEVAELRAQLDLVEARAQALEQALHEPGWLRMDALGEFEFTREGLQMMARLCRLMALKNPLLRRASALKTYYVFGQGVTISAEDDLVAEVVAEFVADARNQDVVFGHQARETNEKALQTDSNLFVTCFTHPRTGRIQLRDIPFDEITDVITNPDDRAEVWFYKREWSQLVTDRVTGVQTSEPRKALYPSIDFQPRPGQRPRMWAGMEVRWDSPVLHVHVNRPKGHKFGVPEYLPALDWARAHAEYLDDFRRLVKVLTKLAYRLKNVKGSQMERAKAKVEQATAEDAPVGQAWISDPAGGEIEPLVKAGGVSVSPSDARQFALMVSAATDIPETMLLGDPSTGNLATATTLDRPTELAFENRRKLWAAVFDRLCQYAIDASVRAPAGKLRGFVERDEWDREVITLREDASRTVNVDWPPIVERDMGEVIETLVKAKEIDGMPWQVLLRTALVALDVDNPDEIVTDAEAVVGTEPEDRTEQEDAVVEVLSQLREVVASFPVAA